MSAAEFLDHERRIKALEEKLVALRGMIADLQDAMAELRQHVRVIPRQGGVR